MIMAKKEKGIVTVGKMRQHYNMEKWGRGNSPKQKVATMNLYTFI